VEEVLGYTTTTDTVAGARYEIENAHKAFHGPSDNGETCGIHLVAVENTGSYRALVLFVADPEGATERMFYGDWNSGHGGRKKKEGEEEREEDEGRKRRRRERMLVCPQS
jgi:hypothetical protein